MTGYPMGNIAAKLDEINKRLKGVPYTLDAKWDDYYYTRYCGKNGKAHFMLLTGPALNWFNTTVWVIDFDDIDAGRLDLKLQEIVKFEDGWLQRLLGLANEWALDALPGE